MGFGIGMGLAIGNAAKAGSPPVVAFTINNAIIFQDPGTPATATLTITSPLSGIVSVLWEYADTGSGSWSTLLDSQSTSQTPTITGNSYSRSVFDLRCTVTTAGGATTKTETAFFQVQAGE